MAGKQEPLPGGAGVCAGGASGGSVRQDGLSATKHAGKENSCLFQKNLLL